MSQKLIISILGLFIGWFLILHLFIYTGLNRAVFEKDTSYDAIFTLPKLLLEGPPLANLWQRWDSHWYLGIADHGYYYKPGEQSSVAFFPLYPLVIRFIATLTHLNSALVGVLLSILFTLCSCFYLFLLAKQLWNNEETGIRSVVFLLIFPVSFFLLSIYTESLFLLLSIASFYYAHTKRWGVAIACAMLLTATRFTGILIVLPLLLLYTEQRWGSFKQFFRPAFFGILCIPLGLLLFSAHLWVTYKDPLLFLKSQKQWFRTTNITPKGLTDSYKKYISDYKHVSKAATPLPVATRLIDIGFTLLFIILTCAAWFILPRSHALFSTFLLIVPLLTGTFQSMPRFALSAFPLFLVLGKITQKTIPFFLISLLFTLFLGLLSLLYVNFYWIA